MFIVLIVLVMFYFAIKINELETTISKLKKDLLDTQMIVASNARRSGARKSDILKRNREVL